MSSGKIITEVKIRNILCSTFESHKFFQLWCCHDRTANKILICSSSSRICWCVLSSSGLSDFRFPKYSDLSGDVQS